MPELSTLGSVIKPTYEGEANTNAFTDAEKSKLAGIEAGAQVNVAPVWADITGVPAALTSAQAAGTASIRAIGTTATTAAAGNHTHTFAQISAISGDWDGTGAATLAAALTALEARIAALESV